MFVANWKGLQYLPYKSVYLWAFLFNCISAAFIFAYKPPQFVSYYLAIHYWPLWIQRHYALTEYASFRVRFYLILIAIFFPIIIGGLNRLRFSAYQNKLNLLKFGHEENRPRVVKVYHDEDSKTILKIRTVGVGVDKFQMRKGDLQAAFNQTVEGISADENSPQYIELVLSTFPLPRLLRFEEHEKQLKEEGQFLVGQSRQGFIVQKIADLPHLLMAGTSGSGKSTFFKQALLGLMQSSPKAQFYLIDLKHGAEFRAFANTPGVKLAKTINPALLLLREVKKEMKARFQHLETQEITKIDPETHNLPRIIVAIDEASEILAIPHRNNPDKEDIIECRQIVNDLAKLGRAAAINLMIATQKVSKTIIDTSLQENLGGRLAFRMATLANSAQALGSKDAREIPAIEGRGRYQFGLKALDIQAPFLTDAQLKYKLKNVSEMRAQFISENNNLINNKEVPILMDITKPEDQVQKTDQT